MRQQGGQGDSLNAQEARHKPPKVDNCTCATALRADKVVARSSTFGANKIRQRSEDVSGYYQQGVVGVEEGTREDAEEEADGKDLHRVR